MQALNAIRELFQHMEWADTLEWKAVRALPSGDSVLHDKLEHLHGVQHVYLATWRGEVLDFKKLFVKRDLAALEQWTRDYHRQASAFLADVRADDLAKSLEIPWGSELEKRLGRPPAPSTLGETMLQVVMHSQYHRGQVNTRIRELGGEPPLIDFISWVWFGKPAPQW